MRSIWREPRPAGVPPVGRTDWLFAGAVVAAALVEAVARPDVELRLLVTLLALVPAPALLLRREHPLGAALAGWGAAGVLSVVQLVADTADLGLYAMLVTPVLLYSLTRWGSGRELSLGIAFVAIVVALGMLASSAGWTDLVGGVVLLLLFVSLAAVFRYRADLWQRQQLEIRNEERVALARELHDTVAHHVSAIAVQAQAGGVVAQAQPDKAAEVLAAIESEASRTLAEMRSMVRLLREDDAASYSPQLGVEDIPGLAGRRGAIHVDVALPDDCSDLSRPLGAALYRIAQESLTNALRHASGATRVEIAVRRAGDAVVLTISDDGQAPSPPDPERGFGLLGMTERAKLLGGTLSAGPATAGGWVVEAVLPLEPAL